MSVIIQHPSSVQAFTGPTFHWSFYPNIRKVQKYPVRFLWRGIPRPLPLGDSKQFVPSLYTSRRHNEKLPFFLCTHPFSSPLFDLNSSGLLFWHNKVHSLLIRLSHPMFHLPYFTSLCSSILHILTSKLTYTYYLVYYLNPIMFSKIESTGLLTTTGILRIPTIRDSLINVFHLVYRPSISSSYHTTFRESHSSV